MKIRLIGLAAMSYKTAIVDIAETLTRRARMSSL